MSTNTHVTHASNKNTHPGMPDIDEEVLNRPKPKPRGTKVQIMQLQLRRSLQGQKR